MRRSLAVVLLLGCAPVVSSSVGAQSAASAFVEGAYQNYGISAGSGPCQYVSSVSGVGQTATGSGGCYDFQNGSLAIENAGTASVAGSLSASGRAFGSGIGYGSGFLSAESYASFADQVTFVAQPGAEAITTVFLSAVMAGSFQQSSAAGSGTSGQSTLRVFLPGGTPEGQLFVQSSDLSGPASASGTWGVPYSAFAGYGYFGFQLQLHVSGSLSASTPGSLDSEANFTASVGSVRLEGASGDITDQYSLVAASGRDYTTPLATTAPEPASIVLLATGLWGLAGRWRRRDTGGRRNG